MEIVVQIVLSLLLCLLRISSNVRLMRSGVPLSQEPLRKAGQEKQQIVLSSSLYGCLTKIEHNYAKEIGK